jgi:predicted nucleic acid-binding protein
MIIADTGAIVALVDADDRWHKQIRALFEAAPGSWLLPWAVLPEIDYLLATHVGRNAQEAFHNDLAEDALAVEWGKSDDLVRARAIHKKYQELRLGCRRRRCRDRGASWRKRHSDPRCAPLRRLGYPRTSPTLAARRVRQFRDPLPVPIRRRFRGALRRSSASASAPRHARGTRGQPWAASRPSRPRDGLARARDAGGPSRSARP